MARKYLDYVQENLIDDKDAVLNIISFASGEIKKKFDIEIDEPEILLTIFSVVYRTFVDKLREKRDAGYTKFKIVIANRLEIGFDNAEDEDYEKNGSFMFYTKHLYPKVREDDDRRGYEDNTISLCSTWNSININTDTKIIKEVSTEALKRCNAMDITMESIEIVIPIFITTYDAMVTTMKLTRANDKDFEYTINFASLFDITAQESSDDTEDIIRFQPSIMDKLGLKSDAKASTKYDT